MTAPLAKKIKKIKAERKQNRIPITVGMQFKSAGALMEVVSPVPDSNEWYCKKKDVEGADEWIYSEGFIVKSRVT